MQIKKLHARSTVRRQEAIAAVCVAFEPLVKSQAMRYMLKGRMGADCEELEQVARVGLLEACASFNAKLGAFPTHATWCIRHALAEYIAGLPNPVRLPSDVVRRISKLQRVRSYLTQELKRPPLLDELAAEMKLAPATIALMLEYDDGPMALDEDHAVDRFRSPLSSPEELLIAEEEAKAVLRQKGR